MGITLASWHDDFIKQLASRGIIATVALSGEFLLLKFQDADHLLLHLISVENAFLPANICELSQAYGREGVKILQVWEDVWLNRSSQVLSRLCSLLGKNKTLHGRKTKVISINQTEADQFFEQYHLQYSASARYKYALTMGAEVVAVASFSAKRNMTRKAPGYTSVELIRFASIDGITVQGGLSKLIRHLIRTISPNDIMTYTDLDWSDGKGYTQLGFERVDTSGPVWIWLNTDDGLRYFPQRLPEDIKSALVFLTQSEADDYMKLRHYVRIFNTGNLKYILHLKN